MTDLNDVLLSKIRSQLQLEKIKLWLEPYTDQHGNQSSEFALLVEAYASSFSKSASELSPYLEHLRQFSLTKLQQNEKFRSQGIATIRLKFSPKEKAYSAISFVETKLSVTGNELVQIVLNCLQQEHIDLKLIYSGKVILPDVSLQSQGVKHNKTVLCMIFSQKEQKKRRVLEENVAEVKASKRGAELLATSSSCIDRYDPQILDQSGRSIDIPAEEKSALTIALLLHEKGRNILKQKQYSLALLILLEADQEFRQCNSDILAQVDNFAVLCLDICWCYLSMNNLDILHDANERLKMSEEFFQKSYGEALQRLLTIKGSSSHEIALFVRLHLLQGVVQYHQGNFNRSVELLEKALKYAELIHVDDSKVTEMMQLGFSASEALMALRACDSNIASATQYAFDKREEKENVSREESVKTRKRNLAKDLGKCANGDDINIDLYEKMTQQFGYSKELSAEALKQCNNNIDLAIELINNDTDNLLKGLVQPKVTKALVNQVASIGFDPVSSEAALKHFNGDADRSVEYLSAHQGLAPQEWITEIKDSKSKEEKLNKNDRLAVKEMAKNISKDGSSYLDICLNEEMDYISKYLAMCRSVK